jgi:hypothetical protein
MSLSLRRHRAVARELALAGGDAAGPASRARRSRRPSSSGCSRARRLSRSSTPRGRRLVRACRNRWALPPPPTRGLAAAAPERPLDRHRQRRSRRRVGLARRTRRRARASPAWRAAVQGVHLELTRPESVEGCGLSWNRNWAGGAGRRRRGPAQSRRTCLRALRRFGNCGALPREALTAVASPEARFFDERLGSYYEDVELAVRLREAGWESWCVPAARAPPPPARRPPGGRPCGAGRRSIATGFGSFGACSARAFASNLADARSSRSARSRGRRVAPSTERADWASSPAGRRRCPRLASFGPPGVAAEGRALAAAVAVPDRLDDRDATGALDRRRRLARGRRCGRARLRLAGPTRVSSSSWSIRTAIWRHDWQASRPPARQSGPPPTWSSSPRAGIWVSPADRTSGRGPPAPSSSSSSTPTPARRPTPWQRSAPASRRLAASRRAWCPAWWASTAGRRPDGSCGGCRLHSRCSRMRCSGIPVPARCPSPRPAHASNSQPRRHWPCAASSFDSVGGFDEGFFPAWFEDVDLARRLADRGLALLYLPAALCRQPPGQFGERPSGTPLFSPPTIATSAATSTSIIVTAGHSPFAPSPLRRRSRASCCCRCAGRCAPPTGPRPLAPCSP